MSDGLLAPNEWADESPGGEGETAIGEEMAVGEEQPVEVELLRQAKDPGQPTRQQVAEHRITHMPFRSWCRWCVMGRARGAQHRRSDDESAIPIIGLDYFFITKDGIKKRSQLGDELPENEAGDASVHTAREAGEIVKCILLRCSKFKVILAHVVPCKGRTQDEDEYVVNTVLKDLEWIGHTSMILRADNERALQAVVQRIIQQATAQCQRYEQVAAERPARYDSQSNGMTEVGVMLVRGLFRTLKLCLESSIARRVPEDHALVPWLLRHTCLLLNTAVKGADGLTAWHRARGRKFHGQLAHFGEQVLYKSPTKGPLKAPQGNMGPMWQHASYLGHDLASNCYVLAVPGGVDTSARSIWRRPESERWNAEALANVQATPWSLRDQSQPAVTFREPAEHSGQGTDAAAPPASRRLRINQSDLDSHGYTEGCQQCEHIQRHGKARVGGQHSNRCRERLVEAIRTTDDGSARIAAHDV